MSIDPDTLAAWCVPELDFSRAGGEVVVGVLGVDPAFDRVATRISIEHVMGQGFAGSDADLFLDELAAHDFLGNRVFHLDPGIHFHKIEILGLVIDQVFDSAGILVADRGDQLDGCCCHLFAQLVGNKG